MTWIYRPRYDHQRPDPTRCRASVMPSQGGGFHSHQCHRPGIIERQHDGVMMKFCKQHDPVAEKARHAARDAKWKAEWQASEDRNEYQRKHDLALDACRAACKLIAEGHNNARALAKSALDMFPEGDKP